MSETKSELLEKAAELGVEIDDSSTKAEIQAAIDAREEVTDAPAVPEAEAEAEAEVEVGSAPEDEEVPAEEVGLGDIEHNEDELIKGEDLLPTSFIGNGELTSGEAPASKPEYAAEFQKPVV